MRRIILVVVVVAAMAAAAVSARSAAAQGGGCAEFGQNVAFLATNLGRTFGQTAAANAPLNDVVEAEQDALCG